MDNSDNPSSRVQRTLWTVWCYIAEAVNRFFRPESINIVNNDPDCSQEPSVDSEPANSAHAESNAGRNGVGEEESLAEASLLNSSRPVVAWELCTDDIDLGPNEESMRYNTQPSTASEEGEGTREEQFAQTGSGDVGLCGAKEDNREKFEVQEPYTCGQDEHEEHANARLTRTADDKMNEDTERGEEKMSAEEETERAETPGDQKTDESMTIIIQEDEYKDKMDHEDEQDLEAEDTGVNSGLIIDVSPENAGNLHKEETKVQTGGADITVMHEEVESSDKALQLIPDNENKSDQAETQVSACDEMSADDRDRKGDPSSFSLHVELEMPGNKSSFVSEDELSDAGQEHVMVHRSENNKEEDQSTLDEREQDSVTAEENVTEVVKKQTDAEIISLTAESQEEDISTGHIACNEELVQNTEIALHTDEFTDGEQEDVAKAAEEQTKTSEIHAVETEGHDVVVDANSEMTATDISTDETLGEKERREEKLSSEVGDEDMETTYTGPSLTVNPEGETVQEVSEEIKNVPPGICGGRLVMSQELNTPTCRETQGGVPEYNNEPGPDENTTRWFLEVGNCEETQTTQLPEEVESKESESFQNTGCSTGGGHLPVSELMEEDEKSTEDIKNSFDLVVEEPAEILTEAAIPQETVKLLVESVIEESRLLLAEEELLVDSMKTGVEHLEKDFEMHVGLTNETDKTTDELQDGAKELLIESEIDVGSCEFKDLEAVGDCREASGTETAEEEIGFSDGQRTTETSFFHGLVDAMNSEQNSNRIPVLEDDITEPELLQQSVKTDREDCSLEMQDVGISRDEIEEDTAEDEMQSKNEMDVLNLQVKEIAAEITTEWDTKENTLVTEFLETENEQSDEAFEISNKETVTADELETMESEPKDLVLVSTEEMAKHEPESEEICPEEAVSSVSERQDVIEEEILDLWIQTALLEDTDGTKQQHGPEPGQETGAEMESSNEELVGFSSSHTEQEKEKLIESRKAELGSDTEMSPSTAESGFLDQSLIEWGPQSSETQLPKSTSAVSSQGIYDLLSDMSESADISELSAPQTNSGHQDILMLETAETRQSHEKEEESVTETGIHSDSGVESPVDMHLHQEFEKPQEETEGETGSQKGFDAEVTDLLRKTEGKDKEEKDVELLTEMSAVYKAEETKVDPLEITESDSDESKGGSEGLFEEEIVPTESGSPDDPCTEFELPSVDEPKDANSFPALNQAEVAEQPTTEFEVEMEVDGSVLDFAMQKSRISVKNPHVRPPKDPRSLLHKPSLDPTPPSHAPRKIPAGVPLGGLGIGIKLPGLGAGFPVLKKTQRVVNDDPETLSQEPETKPEEKSDTPKHDEMQHKPKWMPPRQPGFGNPLMSELKSKLKKTTKD